MPCLLLALAILQAPQAAAKIDVSFPATRLTVAVRQLGTATGRTLEVTPTMAGEVVMVEAKQVEPQALLDRLAEAVSGHWKAEGSGLRLVPDTDLQAKERTAYLAFVKDQLQKVLSGFQRDLKPGGDEGSRLSPIQISSRTAVIQMGARGLTATAPGQRTVYATQPTRMQKAWPGGRGILQNLIAMNRRVATSAAPQKEGEEMPLVEAYAKPPIKLILAVHGKPRGGYEAELIAFDAEGGIVDRDSVDLEVDGPPLGEQGDPVDSEKDVPPPKDEPVALNAESQDLQKLIGSFESMMGGSAPELTATLAAAIDSPAQFDPLRFFVSDCVASYGRKEGKPLVAYLPDTGVELLSTLGRGKVGILQAKSVLENEGGLTFTEKEGWIVARPTHPHQARAFRSDRLALQRLVSASRENLFPRLDDLAAYATVTAQPSSEDWSILYLIFRVPGSLGLVMQEDSPAWSFLRLYGSLTPAQRTALSEGRRLPISGLMPNQQSLLQQIVYGPTGSLDVEDPATTTDSARTEMMEFLEEGMGAIGMGMGVGLPGRSGSDYRSEPTEALPNGLPPNGYLAASLQASPSVAPQGGGLFSLMMGAMTPQQLAYFTSLSEAAPMASMMDMKFDKLRLGQQTRIRLEVVLGERISAKQSLTDLAFPKNAPTFTLETLPADFKKQLDEARKKVKEMMDRMDGLGGVEDPPPPSGILHP